MSKEAVLRFVALGRSGRGNTARAMTRRSTRRSVPACFVDTSGFYAVADADDVGHAASRPVFEARGRARELVTSDYVFVETWCLIRARLGRRAATPHSGHGQRTSSAWPAHTSTRCPGTFNFTERTVHGVSRPSRWR